MTPPAAPAPSTDSQSYNLAAAALLVMACPWIALPTLPATTTHDFDPDDYEPEETDDGT